MRFRGGAGISGGEGHKTFVGRDGVFVVGEGHGGVVFAQGSGGVVGYQRAALIGRDVMEVLLISLVVLYWSLGRTT